MENEKVHLKINKTSNLLATQRGPLQGERGRIFGKNKWSYWSQII